MLMRHEEHGWHDATDREVAELKKIGWVTVSDAERKAIIDKKRAAMLGIEQNDCDMFKSAIIDAQRETPARGRPGRKPKNFGVTSDGNDPDSR